MSTRRFSQVDAFTAAYGGNPVAVVVDAEGLDAHEMQRFARWTNLSETTFLLPSRDTEADYRLRRSGQRQGSFIGHARRAQVVASTIAVIADVGYPQASFSRIAEHAGISPGLIAYHFKTKDVLVRAVVSEIVDTMEAAIRERLADAAS